MAIFFPFGRLPKLQHAVLASHGGTHHGTGDRESTGQRQTRYFNRRRGDPKLKRKDYEEELRRVQAELCSLQDPVKASGERIIVVFEGRDAAGKGGTIRALTERVSPRIFQVVALPAPSDREKSQMYVQRYLAHFPAAGEIVIFDRSWYNRAGVEHVMGFCTKEQHKHFLDVCPAFEKQIVDNGIRLIKYWLEVSNKEQKRPSRRGSKTRYGNGS